MKAFTRGLLVLGLAVGIAGCEAPKEQQEWGARTGGLGLPAKPGSEREADEARAAAAAAATAATPASTAAEQAKPAQPSFEDRKGGLNLSRDKEKGAKSP